MSSARRGRHTRGFASIQPTPVSAFKKVHPTAPIYSVRVNRDYRADGILSGEAIVWFWIGSHAEYGCLLSNR